jgi:hypothetical protein
MFTKKAFDHLDNGFKHYVPLSINFKLNSFMTLTPGLYYNGVAYTMRIHRTWERNKLDTATMQKGAVKEDTIRGLYYAQGFYPTLSYSIAPKFYGMYLFENSGIKAIRHLMSPTLSFSYIPDMRTLIPNNYYQSYIDSTNKKDIKKVMYSVYERGRFGTPVPNGQSGTIAFNLHNSFEMKYLFESDTSEKEKKVYILENLDMSTSWDVFKPGDTCNMAPVQLNAGTRLFDNKMSVRGTTTIEPYHMNYYGLKTREFEWKKNHDLGTITNASLSMGTSFTSSEGKKKDKKLQNLQPGQQGMPGNNNPKNTLGDINTQEDVDFSNPWSVNLNYNWNYNFSTIHVISSTDTIFRRNRQYTQTLSISGDISLTKKWKIGYNSGYDFTMKQITFTNFSFVRDLHCFQASFNWVPMGQRKSYSFTINAKSSILRDLKYDKRKSWYDNF